MRKPIKYLSIAGVLTTLLLVAPAPAAAQPNGPQYDAAGNLKRPVGFKNWVFVGANIGLKYKADGIGVTPRELGRHKDGMIGDFHNVYITPEAYKEYVRTGKFPDDTVLVMDVYEAKNREAQGIVDKGFFPGAHKEIEVAVKNKNRPDGSKTDWAYYVFQEKDKTAKAFPDTACYACHLKHASVDNVWVQFYPTLRDGKKPIKATPTMVRYDARSPQGKAMLKIYADAVGKMKKLPESDPNSWTFQWYTHWVNGDTTKAKELNRIFPMAGPNKTLATNMWNTCQPHFGGVGPDFLPWHRMYVYYFEKIIRDVSGEPSFTLPYWNYSTPDMAIRGVIPPEFTVKTSALYIEKRNPGVNLAQPIQQGQPGDPLSTAVLGLCTYGPAPGNNGFNSTLNAGLHGNVHGLVGNTTNMGSVPYAANDPIFWLHHCNIDRLWASWNAGGRVNPALTNKYWFAENKVGVQKSEGDFLDIAALGYNYDKLEPVPTCPKTPKIVITAADGGKRVATVKAKGIKLGPQAVKIKLEDAPEKGVKPLTLTQRVRDLPAGRRLVLFVKDLRVDRQPGVLFHVFLDLPANADSKTLNAHHVGIINFFDAMPADEAGGHMMDKKAHTTDYAFDVTDLAQRLQDKKLLTSQPTITIIPYGQHAERSNPIITEIHLHEIEIPRE